MAEENVAIVRRGFMAVLEDDWRTALATLDPGKITRTEYFNDQNRALEVAGLREDM